MPSITLPELGLVVVPEMDTPSPVLPAITFRAAGTAPPTMLLVAPEVSSTPVPLAIAVVPETSRPMKLPSTILPVAVAPVISTPALVLPEITSLNDVEIPPIVLSVDPVISTPTPFGAATVPVASVPMSDSSIALPPTPEIATPAPEKLPMASPRIVSGVAPVGRLKFNPLAPAPALEPLRKINGVAPVPGWVVASMVSVLVIVGSGVSGAIVCTPAAAMSNEITLELGAALATRMAFRNDPAPESLVLVTRIVARSSRVSRVSNPSLRLDF